MKRFAFLFICFIAFLSCKQNKNDAAPTVSVAQDSVAPPNYFPLTTFIRGQLAEIKKSFKPVLEYNIKGERMDSAWLKPEDFETEIAPFLIPTIDTANMVDLFKEEKFLDQSINAYTFTYSPSRKLPDSIDLRQWDVYVNPESGKVSRIYMVKEKGAGRQQQLTWQADQKWCRIININSKPDGTFFTESERKIVWDF